MLGVFFGLLFLGAQIFVAILVSSFATYAYVGIDPITMGLQIIRGLNVYSLMAVPLFILAGEIMSCGGITERLVALSQTMVG